jgi:hypothetical protein
MLLHEAFDKTLKYCGISATEITKISGVSSSRISQFKNGLFLEGKGSDLTSRSVDQMLKAAEKINPKARLVFSLYLADEDPDDLRDTSWTNSLRLESMDQSEISQLLMAIADALDRSKARERSSIAKAKKFSQAKAKNNQENLESDLLIVS